MGYAALGIPAAMVMFQSMGERMNKAFSVVIKKTKELCGCSKTEATEFDLILSSLVTSGIVVTCGALLYHTQEGWSFFDSMYYTFITLSTIGFGDFVALQNNKVLQFRPGYVACSFIFLLLGLASLSSSINLLGKILLLCFFEVYLLYSKESEIFSVKGLDKSISPSWYSNNLGLHIVDVLNWFSFDCVQFLCHCLYIFVYG